MFHVFGYGNVFVENGKLVMSFEFRVYINVNPFVNTHTVYPSTHIYVSLVKC